MAMNQQSILPCIPFEDIGKSFADAYYKRFDTYSTRVTVQCMYHRDACLTFEGQPYQGPANIMEKLMSIPLKDIQRAMTAIDCQPTVDGGVLISVIGQLRSDSENDKAMGFSHIFVLRNENGNFYLMHEIFRLSLYNFAS